MRLSKHLFWFCFACILPMRAANGQTESAGTIDVAALRAQAYAYQHGTGIRKDVAKAIAIYCQAAKQGDATSQFNLGWIYANGKGTERNDALAAFFYSLAAQQDHKQAQFWLPSAGMPSPTPPACMRDPVDEVLHEALAAATPEKRKVIEILFRLAPTYGIEPSLGLAVIQTESNFNSAAVSPKNAQGLMQLIPETAARFNVTKPFDPEQNIRGGLAYLRWLLAYFKGDVALVAAAYNAGEGTVNRYKGIPPYMETREYVKRIKAAFKKDGHPFDASITSPSPELANILGKTKM